VVLHFGEQDHVARAEDLPAPRLRDEIDALGRSSREDDLLRRRRAEIAGDLRARGLVSLGGARAQLVQAAVDVGVVVLVVAAQRIENGARFLRRRGVVEINERVPVNLLVEDRELGADGGPVAGVAG
jgi:hypothetical protein